MLEKLKSKKARPWIYGVVIVAGIVLLFLIMGGRGGGGGGGAVQSGPSEGAQLQMAAMQHQTGLAQLGAQTQLGIATLEFNARAMEIESTLAALELQQSAYLATEPLRIEAARETALAEISTQEEIQRIRAQESVMLQQIAGQTAIAQAEFQYLTFESMANAQAAAAQAQANAQIEAARIQAGAQKKSSSNNLLGSIVGGIFKLFSDVRLKSEIEWRGQLQTEHGEIAVFNYRIAGQQSSGVMAQELEMIAPHLVSQIGDYLAVNYEAI